MSKQSNSSKKPKFNQEKQDKLVEMITNGETFQSACSKVGISRTTEWQLRQNDNDYKDLIETAKEIRTQAVESMLYEECLNGNITAIIFYLKTHKPKTYNVKQLQVVETSIDKQQIEEIRMI